METKFCKTCGQANLPNETVCLKCGLNLGQTFANASNRSSSPANEDPFKTIAVGQQESGNKSNIKTPSMNEPKKNNSKLLWILGAAGAFVIFGGFLIIALAAGIYFYSDSKTEFVNETNTSKEETHSDKTKQNPKQDEGDPILTKMTDDDINKHINEKLKILGIYQLGKAGSPKKKTFEGSNAEQYGLYFPKNERKEFVIFSMATFTSTQKAKDFVADKAEKVKKAGGEIISHTDKTKGDTLLFNEKGNGGQIIDCNEGVCVNVFGTKGKHTSGFYTAYINRP